MVAFEDSRVRGGWRRAAAASAARRYVVVALAALCAWMALACGDSSSCTQGAEACACREATDGGDADAGAGLAQCDEGLTCQEGRCVSPGDACPDGVCESACSETGRCPDGLRCDALRDRCVPCEQGSRLCQCGEQESCDRGLACTEGLCLAPNDTPPENPRCYTPCVDDLRVDGGVLTCSNDHLIEGCLDGRECVGGVCLAADDARPACKNDNQCPFFQVCLLGACYAQCERDDECHEDFGCFKRVCRQRCQASSTIGASSQAASACPTGMRCEASDGENGFCVPLASADATDPGATSAVDPIALSTPDVQFSNVRLSGEFQILPQGERPRVFTIRKVSHVLTKADGSEERVGPLAADASCDAAKGECPLSWLSLSNGSDKTRGPSLQTQVGGACAGSECPTIAIDNAAGVPAVRWEGVIEVSTPGLQPQRLSLRYVERPEGRFVGQMVYFGTFNGERVDEWLARSSRGDTSNTDNGLLARWGALRTGALQGSFDEWRAVLTSTQEESWRYAEVQRRCRELNGGSTDAICYPYSNTAGVQTYVSKLSVDPVPTGLTQLPFAINLRVDPDDGERLIGRVDTAGTLHYPGNPAIAIAFDAQPTAGDACDPKLRGDCVLFLARSNADAPAVSSLLGGRYVPQGAPCEDGFEARSFPWLLPDFQQGTSFLDATRVRDSCLDGTTPYPEDTHKAANVALSAANPVPDGKQRLRELTFLDGALVNQNELFLLFRETFGSFVEMGAADRVAAYGYLRLVRQPADIDPTDDDGNGVADAFEGAPAVALQDTGVGIDGATCDADLLSQLQLSLDPATPGAIDDAVSVLITGSAPAGLPLVNVHYLCEDTGLFDGGPDPSAPIACPQSSKVTYFALVPDAVDPDGYTDLSQEACQQGVVCTPPTRDPSVDPCANAANPAQCQVDAQLPVCSGGTCQSTLAGWIASSNPRIAAVRPQFRCTDFNDACGVDAPRDLCDDDRTDLTQGKCFYAPPSDANQKSVSSFLTELVSAFRYKTRFQSRTGAQVGFAPQICIPNSDQIPYCYEPDRIEEVRARVDCLVHVHSDLYASLSDPIKAQLSEFLRGSFSQFAIHTDPDPVPDYYIDGFEHLYAELLVMLGDEALTAAFASRFDLAQAGSGRFLGTLFEGDDGLDLSGIAGFELQKLYESTQYYQQAVDRLYRMGPDLSASLQRNSQESFVSQETVVRYLNRVIRAATQKARAWSQVAVRYAALNQNALARRVVEREYVATYLESAMLAHLMQNIEGQLTSSEKAAVRMEIEQAGRRYRMTLLEMRDVYSDITGVIKVFGFPRDYIPFPALDSANVSDTNAFEVMQRIADAKVDFARQREEAALSANRSFNTDAAQFQAELVRVRNTYEDQLQELCGAFTTYDGRTLPAIRKYADTDDSLRRLGDPCGLVGSGQIAEKLLEIAALAQGFRNHRQAFLGKLQEIDDEKVRVRQQCAVIADLNDFKVTLGGVNIGLEGAIATTRITMEAVTGSVRAAGRLAEGLAGAAASALNASASVDPVTTAGSGYAFAAAAGAAQAGGATVNFAAEISAIGITTLAETAIAALEAAIRVNELVITSKEAEAQCSLAQVDSIARIRQLYRDLLMVELEALRSGLEVQIQQTALIRLHNQAKRLQDEEAETEELLIGVEAARNDPNIRIYRNDAVVNADIAFEDALRAAYQATRVFEYYTSQSYAPLEQLFLVRMVSAGDYNLENYMLDLRNAFFEFEQTYGNPDDRVQVLSLKDDLLAIPFLDEQTGAPLTAAQRTARMRARLQDVDMLDANGYVSIPFAGSFDPLSPLTTNHKINFIEVNLEGSGLGDPIARVYLRSQGTGLIRTVQGGTNYYVFPTRTAVINPFFNGNRLFAPDVYRNGRFRDRPLVNTAWQLLINQRDEQANRDIDLSSLDDIRLYVNYTDFTGL